MASFALVDCALNWDLKDCWTGGLGLVIENKKVIIIRPGPCPTQCRLGTTRVRPPGCDGLILICFVAPSPPPGWAIRTRISGSSRDHLEIYQHYLSSTRRVAATREEVSLDKCSIKGSHKSIKDKS